MSATSNVNISATSSAKDSEQIAPRSARDQKAHEAVLAIRAAFAPPVTPWGTLGIFHRRLLGLDSPSTEEQFEEQSEDEASEEEMLDGNSPSPDKQSDEPIDPLTAEIRALLPYVEGTELLKKFLKDARWVKLTDPLWTEPGVEDPLEGWYPPQHKDLDGVAAEIADLVIYVGEMELYKSFMQEARRLKVEQTGGMEEHLDESI
ncbi:hypothetical protein BDZ89DRAFT_1048384 [Hymenopellis radicata]|nr:hypothetical protein BDZ89DRAFT_1048384 [Hymenopellis radicata]